MRMQASTPDFVGDYIKRLKHLYIKGGRFTQPDWPPIKTREAITLVIISKHAVEEGFSKQQIETLEDDYVHGKIDSIMAYKKEIELGDILTPVPSDDGKSSKVPKVLMDGAPGVGKTTLAVKACTDWADNRMFGRYELFILVSLRELKYKKGEKLEDLFPCCHDKSVVDYYAKNGGKGMVMIFDGYDELSYQQRRINSIFLDIIRGDVLPDCAVLVTSRPYASNYLHQLDSINRHIEVIGFKKEQIYACIEKNLSDRDSAKALVQQLKEREDISSLCYIPLNCMIMIHVYEQKKALSKTMTEILHQFIIDSVTRDVKYVNLSPELENVCIEDLNHLPYPASEQLSSLEKLAFQNLVKDQFIFSQEELLSAFSSLKSLCKSHGVTTLCLGLLTSVHTVDSTDRHFQFLHLSIQEYLAARYAAKISNNGEQVDILQKFVDEPRFRLFLLFFVGMMPIDSDTARVFFHTGLQSSVDEGKTYDSVYFPEADPVVDKFLYFAHMIFESQQFETFDHLFDMLNDKKVLSLKNRKLTLFDCTVLAHFLCSIDHSWNKLDLQNCSLDVHSLQVFDQVYQNRKSSKKTNFDSINFNENDPEMISQLNIFPWLSEVKILTFENQTSKVNKALDLRTIAHIPQLSVMVDFSCPDDVYMNPTHSSCICKTAATEVELCRAELGETFVDYLHGIKELKLITVDCGLLYTLNPFIQSLKVLVLSKIDDIDGWLVHSASILGQSNSLQELKICDVCITSSSARTLFQSLLRNTSIKQLYISAKFESLCQVEELGEVVKAFVSMNGTVTSFHVCNCIDDQLAQYLIAGLKNNSTLDMLDVSSNPLAINTIEELIGVAVNHRKLSQLSIENNVFQKQDKGWTLKYFDKVSEKLFCALSYLKVLCHCYQAVIDLSLSSSDLDSFTCTRLFQALQQNRHIKTITFKDTFTPIANDNSVLCALKRMLATNNTMQSLHYRSNKKEHDCVYEYIAAGISESLSLTELSLRLHSFSGILRLMRGLRNCRLKVLKLSPDFSSKSSLILTQDDSKLIGFEFEQFLSINCTLIELNLEFSLDEWVVSGISEGLLKNKSLKVLRVRLGPLVSHGAAKLFCSASKTLTTIDVQTVGSLMKEDSHWNLELQENGITMWSQLKHVMKAGKPKYKIMLSETAQVDFPSSYQVYKVFSVLALSKSLKLIDFSRLCFLDSDKFGGKKIGLALRDMLTSSLSLEVLILNSSKFPQGVWEYAAEGLRTNNSLKVLDLCHSGILPNEAANIYASLKLNCNLEKLDISQNPDIKQGDHPKLNSAIQTMFECNSSICEVNMKNSVNDKGVIKAVSGLQRSRLSRLKKLVLDEQCFSVSTVQHILLMVKDHFGLKLQFSETSLIISAEQNIWLNFIDATLKKSAFSWSRNLKTSKSGKLFCSLCNICLQNKMQVNIVELELDDIDNEAVIVIFKLLSEDTLSRLKKLSLKGKFGYIISGNATGHSLKNMLVSNETLHELVLPKIDEAVATGLASGLLANNTLKKVSITTEALNDRTVAELLTSLDSPNAGLLKLEISGIPPIHRPTEWSMWSMALDESIPYCYVSTILFPQFICTLCKICEGHARPDSRTASKCILASLSKLSLSISDLDIALVVNLFKLLAANCTFKTLNLSAKGKLLRDGNIKLCRAIEDMLVSNTAIKELNLSGTLNDEIACGIVAGLKRNQTLKKLQIDANILNLRSIAAIMEIFSREESNLTYLAIHNLFILHKYENLNSPEWKVEVLDEMVWCSFLNVLKKFAPGMKLLAALNSLTCGGCIHNSPRFDIACEKLNFQLTREEEYTTKETCYNADSINVETLLTNITTLKFLTLKGYSVSEKVCSYMACSARYLKKLVLRHNSINLLGAIKLIQGLTLQTGTILDELDISHNNLNQSSCNLGHALKGLLESNMQLKTLKCAGCHINDNVCECIASGTQSNHKLTCLDLSCNDITTIGVKALMCSLKQNCCLRELDFSKNTLFTKDDDISLQKNLGQTVCIMLECNHTLVNLNLDCDTFDGVILKDISKGLKKNTTLKVFTANIDKCDVSDIISLIPTLSLNLTCLNFSDICSLLSSDAGWTVEVKRNNRLSQIFTVLCLSEININKVVISKATVPELNFSECSLSCLQFLSLFESLEDNHVLKKLSLSINFDLTRIEHEALGYGIKWMLKKNQTLEHLELLGDISSELFQGLKAGIETNSFIKELHVQVNDLQLDNIVKFAQSVELTSILRVNFYPLLELFRSSTSSLWLAKGNYFSPLFLNFFYSIDQGNLKQSILRIIDISTDDTLTCSLIHALEDSYCTYLEIPSSWTIGEKAYYELERMISCSKHLQQLAFDSINDSVVVAITKGLRDNKHLHELVMDVAPLTESVLSELLQSFCNYSLKLTSDGHRICFVRCISEFQSSERGKRNVFSLPPTQSPNLEKVLRCLSFTHGLRDLTIASPQQTSIWPRFQATIGQEIMGNTLKDMLKNCKSLKVLNLQCAVTIEMMQGLVSGLKDNLTLHSLEVNTKSLSMGDIWPLFSSLSSSNITKLELLQQFLFLKVPGSSCWKIEILKYCDKTSFHHLFFIHKYIEIDVVICQYVGTVVLNFVSENIRLILIILKSIEYGNLPVKYLGLVYDNVTGDWNKAAGSAIETMLKSKENKSLEELTIVCLRDKVIETHIVSGLCQTTKSLCVIIRDKLLSAENSSLVQKIINADFTNSSICEVQIDDNISLHNRGKKVPNWKIQEDNRRGIPKCKTIPIWKVNSDDKNTIIRTFFLINLALLNNEGCRHSDDSIIIGDSVLRNLKELDVSHACLNLVTLFEILQNNTNVVNLNLSNCTQISPVDMSRMNKKFKSMLISNTTLNVLNLTGIVDAALASSLIEVLPLCSLKYLSIDLNIKTYAFDKFESLLCSYANSNLIQLTVANICHLQKDLDTKCIPQCISLECNLALPSSVSLLKSWSTLFMLITISKQFPRLNLTLGAVDSLTLKVFKMFFSSVSQCQIDRNNAPGPVKLLQSLKALQLGVTYDTSELAVAIIESLQHCHISSLEELNLSHDKSIFRFDSKCQALASCYEQLLSTSQTLQSVNFGHINDIIAQRVAAGLKCNSKLHTLQFRAILLTAKSVACLFRVILEGNLTCMQITDGIFVEKIEEGSNYIVDIVGDKIFTCKIFIALTQASPYHCSKLMTSFAPDHKLDLSIRDVRSTQSHSIKSMLTSDVIEHIMTKGGSFVSELVLSGNTELTKNDEDLVGSALEQLLISDVCTLCSLRLDACQIPDAVCMKISEGLTDNNTLKTLDLSRNLLTSYGVGKLLASLAANRTLIELDLSDNELLDSQAVNDEIGKEVERMFKENHTLAVLHLISDSDNCLSPSIARCIAIGVCDNTALRVLSLQIKEEEVLVKLFESLQHNHVLSELNIEESSITNALVGLSIQQMLKCNKSLEILKMGYSGITDEVCELISDGLNNNKHLKTLNLCNNRICNSGMTSLFQILDGKVCCLQELNVSENFDHQWQALGNVQLGRILATNLFLETLKISDCYSIGEWLGLALFEGLKSNSKLRTLDISRNYFDAPTSKVFMEMLTQNTTLVELNISYCQFTCWNLNFAKTSLKKVIIDTQMKCLFDFNTEMEVDVIQLY